VFVRREQRELGGGNRILENQIDPTLVVNCRKFWGLIEAEIELDVIPGVDSGDLDKFGRLHSSG